MKYSKFTLLIFGAICISIFFLPGCNQEQEVIKIGVVGTMTGINSDLSVSGRRGVELAVDEFNKAGGLNGRKIELVQIYSSLWSNTVGLIKNGGTAIEGMFIVGPIDLDGKTPDVVRLKERFLDQYGENLTYSAVYSYEATSSLFQAMKMGPDLKPSTIKNNIISIKDFKGLEENYQIDKFGDNNRKFIIFRIEDGHQRRVD